MKTDKDKYLQNINNYSPDKLLKESSKFQDLENINLAIKNGADIHAAYDGALFNSNVHDNVEIVDLLLKSDYYDDELKNEQLSVLIEYGRYEMVKCFIDNGADIKTVTDENLKHKFNVYLRNDKIKKLYDM